MAPASSFPMLPQSNGSSGVERSTGFFFFCFFFLFANDARAVMEPWLKHIYPLPAPNFEAIVVRFPKVEAK